MRSDTDTIYIPNINPTTGYLIPTVINRGVAKQLIAAKGNSKAIYALSLLHRISLQAAGHLSRCRLKEIENATAVTTR
jgi:hypothetical protein